MLLENKLRAIEHYNEGISAFGEFFKFKPKTIETSGGNLLKNIQDVFGSDVGIINCPQYIQVGRTLTIADPTYNKSKSIRAVIFEAGEVFEDSHEGHNYMRTAIRHIVPVTTKLGYISFHGKPIAVEVSPDNAVTFRYGKDYFTVQMSRDSLRRSYHSVYYLLRNIAYNEEHMKKNNNYRISQIKSKLHDLGREYPLSEDFVKLFAHWAIGNRGKLSTDISVLCNETFKIMADLCKAHNFKRVTDVIGIACGTQVTAGTREKVAGFLNQLTNSKIETEDFGLWKSGVQEQLNRINANSTLNKL